ncbi:MAG: hypothetical protein KUG77_20590 [Nannocystaceae bacterium]|nr:hypothetical protein [Nannocystaceae bacterium]
MGLELSDDVLIKAYTAEVSLVYAAQGVPASEAGRSLLIARAGNVLPIEGYVGFLDGQAGRWSLRGVDLGVPLNTPPVAFDLDADGLLDALVTASGSPATLRGACSQGDTLTSCLDVSVMGTPESVIIDEDGIVFVATQADGLWAYRLGECL